MIAVIASLVLLFYILIPSGIFRFVTSLTLPIKKFHKTKAQDITFAILTCLLPFGIALVLVWYVVAWPFPTHETLLQRRHAYRIFFLSMDNDKQMDEYAEAIPAKPPDPGRPAIFWSSLNSVLKRQGRFLSWFYFLVVVEAGGFSWLAHQFRAGKRRWRDRIGAWVLPPVISEWHVMLTDFGSPSLKRAIELDILSTDGILYQGKLKDYFFDVEGELSGILLSHALRFDRDEYIDHKRADILGTLNKSMFRKPPKPFTQESSMYWREIPGADLFYIPKSRIANINVRHVIPASDVPKAAGARLAERKIKDLVISEKPKNDQS